MGMEFYMRFFLYFLCLCFFVFAGQASLSQDDQTPDEDGNQKPSTAGSNIYLSVKPAFVVNYGGPGRLKYIKLDVSIRVKDTPSSNAVRHHMPLIRDFLVREFSKLEDMDVDTQEGKENVRLAALEGVKALIKEEDGEEGITDLFFNQFVIQR